MENNDQLKIQNSHSYDLIYWKEFFSNNIKEDDVNSFVEITNNNIIELKNVKINNKYTFNGLIKLDNYSCPCFYKKFQICSNKETFIGYFKYRHIKGYGEIISNNYTYRGYIYDCKKSKKGSYLLFLINNSNDEHKQIIKCDDYKNASLIYNGMWKNNKRNGHGTLKLSFTKKNNIDYVLKENKKYIIYNGWWKNNKRHFYGIQNYINNNCKYIGFWKNNKKWKYGEIIWYYNVKNETNRNAKKKIDKNAKKKTDKNVKKKIQNVYIGEWKNDTLNGIGTYFWFKKKYNNNIITHKNANYDKYLGYWKKGKKNGYGIFYYNCGNKYIGMWKNNKKEGLGYMIYINGTVSKCCFKNDIIISEIQINPEYQINNLYTNSICKVINFFFLKKYFNISNKNIQLLYKIIYTNFDFLIDIYERCKTGNGKKANKNKQSKIKTSPNFTLTNLWKIFYKCNILNLDFTLSDLNKLVLDHTTICEENELYNILKQNIQKKDIELSIILEEKKIIKYFFYKSFDLLNVLHFVGNKWKDNHISPLRDHKTFYEKISKTKSPQNGTANLINKTDVIENYHDTNVDSDNDNTELHIDENQFCALLKYAIFNKDLYILKGSKELYKIIKFNKKKIKIKHILKKIYFFLITNKKQYDNHYLYYVLYSLFESSTPLICSFLSMIRNKNKKKQTAKRGGKIRLLEMDRNNITYTHCSTKSNDKEIKLIGSHNCINNQKFSQINRKILEIMQNEDSITYLKNMIEFTNVYKYNIHEETREISFICFLSTLVHVSIRLNNFRNVTDQFADIVERLKKNYIKKQNHTYYFGSRKFTIKRNHLARNNHNNETTKKLMKNNNSTLNLTKGNKNKATSLPLENISSELISILKIYVYYFIFYFLIFESKDSFFSIFNIKLDLSIKLRDVLLFLIQLKLVKKSKKNNNPAGYINLDNYSKIAKNNNKKKINIKNKMSKILTCSGKNDKNVPKKTLTIQNNDKENNKELVRHEKIKSRKISLESTRKKDKRNIKKEKKKERKKKRTNCKNKNEQNIEAEIKDYPEIGHNKKRNNILTSDKNNKNNLNMLAKDKNCFNEIFLKKKSNIFSLSYFEILSIFSKILNTKNLNLISDSCCDLYFKKLRHTEKKRLHKINKTDMLKICVTRYMEIIKRKRQHIVTTFFNSNKKQNNNKICRNKTINKNTEGDEKYPTPIYTKKYGMKIATLLDKKLSELEQNMENYFLTMQSEVFKKGNTIKEKYKKDGKKKKKKYEQKNKSTYVNNKENYKLNNPNDGMLQKTIIKIKRRHEIKKKVYLLRKSYRKYCKNYMNIIDYYNISLTPYELVLFFLNKKKNNIKNE
ncbi:conserved Plasmodium protein, unknown function [Plasmodium vinckei vinckei]|uniref:MORN repeat protein n=1 Tax=Plasmodium vinckei vinckei TaxID=54757 RepID=A0A449BUW8_PLAVN|nr:conserved Plasmodium protein, unknown function [Plasmodium vinckei vinckei]VEV57270.1 conserved Plasmodium protein, unknown function [Plasmodium vinckei vinckei]